PLQRLYSNFANGWPGRALLLLRLTAFLFLIERFLASRSHNDHDVWLSAIAAVAGAFLLAGLWTPISAAVMALIEIWIAVRPGDDPTAHLLAAAMAASLALLGPGACSVDARLFGRRRISIDDL